MAEIEFAVLANQCLGQQIPNQGTMRQETTAWAKRRNEAKATINWHFTSENAHSHALPDAWL